MPYSPAVHALLNGVAWPTEWLCMHCWMPVTAVLRPGTHHSSSLPSQFIAPSVLPWIVKLSTTTAPAQTMYLS